MSTFEELLYDTLYEVMEQAWDQAEAELVQAKPASDLQDSSHG